MGPLDFIYKRHSVRSFKDAPVSGEHIREIIKAATYAPSGKNAQNWHFVVINDKTKIAEIAAIVERKNESLASFLPEADQRSFKGMVKYHTVFKGAPSLVLVYAGPYATVADQLLAAKIMPPEEIATYARPNPGIQNIASAMENLHLAAASLGYGTCWMTGPTYAADEITEYIGFQAKEGYHLAALTPLGIPTSVEASYPPRKSLDEVMTVIE